MHLPPSVIPIFEAMVRRPSVPLGTPFEIWKAEEHRTWVDSFTELGIALFNSDIPEDGLPQGYVLVAFLFDWEAQCQFSGWHAFSNREATMDRVFQSFRAVGLEGEAVALEAAFATWNHSGGNVDAASAAYEKHSHEHSVDLDRLEFLVCYFVDNADRLFYLAE